MAIGMRELASIRAEMEGVMRRTNFQGSFAQFIEFLNTDPKFFYTGPDALLAGYRDAGCQRVNIAFREGPYDWDALHAFAERVLPAFGSRRPE